YVGFSNLWFDGQDSKLDPGGRTPIDEHAFYHHCDPATISGWRTPTGVSLRWTRDLRFATADDVDLNTVNSDSFGYFFEHAAVDSFVVVRRRAATEDTLRTIVTDLFFEDSEADPDSLFSYKVRSIHDGREYAFSRDSVVVETTVLEDPHFWASKPRHQEAFYHRVDRGGKDTPIIWPIRFHCDRDVNPDDIVVQIFSRLNPARIDSSEYDSSVFNYDPDTYDITFDFATSTKRFRGSVEPGGIFYRLKYDGGGNGVEYFPSESGGAIALVSSSINNRVLSRNWFSYQMNLGSDAWRDILTESVRNLNNGIEVSGISVRYGTVLFDSALGVAEGVANWVRPYDYGSDEIHREACYSLLSGICGNSEFGQMKFVPNLGFDIKMIGRFAAADYSTFGGCWDDKLTYKGDSDRPLLNMLWEHQATPPQWRNISQERINLSSNLSDREQALVGYLLTRESSLTGRDRDDVLGYSRTWATSSRADVNITPEQLLRVGDEVNDVLDPYNWPLAADWGSSSEVDLLYDLEQATGAEGIVRRGAETTFLAREFYVDGGTQRPDTRMIALWDMDEDLPPMRTFTLSEIFPNIAPGDTIYELEFVGPGHRVVDGATFITNPILGSTVHDVADSTASIFFYDPVCSPTVEPVAINTISGNPKYISTLRVSAWHWNDEPLDIVVNCKQVNGDSTVVLSWQSDSTYAAELANVTADDNTYYLPFRAEGTDGLMLYGQIEVVVDGGYSQRFIDRSAATVELATEIDSEPLAVMPVDASGDRVVDLVITSAVSAGQFFDGYDGEGRVPDFYERREDRFGSSGDYPPIGTPSCVAADYNGDGHEDFFSSHARFSRLYRWNPDLTTPRYEIAPTSVMPEMPDSTFAASWGDYNRDGWIDLAVAGSIGGQDSIYFYRNELDTLRLVQAIDVEIDSVRTDVSAPYSMLWADLDYTDGNRLELIVGHKEGGVSTLRVFSRLDAFNKSLRIYEFEEVTDTVFPAPYGPPEYVTKPVLADFDGDGDQDLVVACSGRPDSDNLLFYQNVNGHFELSDKQGWSLAAITENLSGVLVSDMDPDGAPDIVTIPAGAAAPRLLLNRSSTNLEFAEEATTLPIGAASGGLAYDWLGGKPNLYLAKGPSGGQVEEFYYGYEPQEGVSLGRTVRVLVGETDIMNTSGIGTRVEVEWDGKHAYQWINGGEGRRGQQPRDLVFSIGQVSSPMIVVRALWPDGVVTEHARFQSDADTISIDRYEAVAIDESSIYDEVMMDTDFNVWYRFSWKADRSAEPEVVFHRNTSSNPWECECALPGAESITLTRDMADVSVSWRQDDDGVFVYEVIWIDRCCVTNCEYTYEVRNSANGLVTTSASRNFKTPRFCLSVPGF
ncbi:MAG: hypothetical protein DRQ64_05760, partial [Gammaproteobacteria bacterium]